jgi:hypothetical protein
MLLFTRDAGRVTDSEVGDPTLTFVPLSALHPCIPPRENNPFF